MKPLTPHWADQTAVRIIGACGDRESYTVASGITPSGTVHIGNFREVITVEFVAKALESLGKKVRFIYSWDDFDTFRKVPVNLPQQDMLKEELRRPISRVPDPYGEDASYAAHNIRVFEEDLAQIGIEPEFLYQHKRYSDGLYAEGIKKALENKDTIKTILNKHRSTPLGDDWLPTAVYCEACDRDEMEYERYDGGYEYSYKCSSCGHEATTDIRTTKNLKLNWRTDWPMRWDFEKVDFEPGGKDHSSDGGSYDTGKRIVKEIYGFKAPQYLQYDFVSIKGGTGKMSSSSGKLLTLREAFAVYEPQMVRWIFASQRPNHDFSIAFDVDVIKVYDEFDRAEKQALGPKPEKLGKWPMARRTYELSAIGELYQEAPYRAPFRELCSRLQIFDGDVNKTLERYYADDVRTELDRQLFERRCEKALAWLELYAPDEFKYKINQEPVEIDLDDSQKAALSALRALVESTDLDAILPKDLNQKIYDDVIRKVDIEAKHCFQAVYMKLINREQGPRLPGFLKELGKERILKLI
ncbi:lysine--tRNA ligase [Pseudobacteriovorax antillogorgiicola]|uniref:Lysine--tRNA ligase n=1 Tax=Pseudobacteriovorax antillogorgiicola TaxID=1513793 RepID=A0A1Y6C847_9BACT|nr:lysine--tRNA ligase [Pseudobacteriovorax antillogorgiicola]TCS51803.1 lysyl-tRNA synthetase class I [Pseudobacteriovorax antillogorgiicola]SMF50096.1 lysyl-tRNA synthetase, class I [Pseudobacteriovorax antillogorgiicola]